MNVIVQYFPELYTFQKWLEVSSKRRNGPPCCELCQYQYLRHKKFVVSIYRLLHLSAPIMFALFMFRWSYSSLFGQFVMWECVDRNSFYSTDIKLEIPRMFLERQNSAHVFHCQCMSHDRLCRCYYSMLQRGNILWETSIPTIVYMFLYSLSKMHQCKIFMCKNSVLG